MGTSRSAGEFSRKITQMATVTQSRQKQIVEQAALAGKEIVIAQAATQGVSRTSQIAGGSWNVRYDIRGFSNPTALLRITGPFHLVNNPTAPHRINRKVGRAKGRGAKRLNKAQALAEAFGGKGAYKGGALKFPDGGFRHVVQHPGTKGKGIWQNARKKVDRAIPIVMSQRIVGGWRSALR